MLLAPLLLLTMLLAQSLLLTMLLVKQLALPVQCRRTLDAGLPSLKATLSITFLISASAPTLYMTVAIWPPGSLMVTSIATFLRGRSSSSTLTSLFAEPFEEKNQ